MNSKIIEEYEVRDLKVSSLPTRPTAKEAFGGRGYSAKDMKAAFDRFPEYILTKLNLLIEDLLRQGEDSYVGSYKANENDNFNLQNVMEGISSGELADMIYIQGQSLASKIWELEYEIEELKRRKEASV